MSSTRQARFELPLVKPTPQRLIYGILPYKIIERLAMEGDPRELDLVKEAITARVSGCCLWEASALERVNRNRELAHWGLTPKLIKELLIEHVEAGGLVEQRIEDREPWRDYHAYWYRVNLSIDGVPRPLFIEVRLIQAGPTLPVVHIVSSHF